MPTVSVIIPAYNSARFLPEAIESVLAQTYKDYEIIVVDDGSADNTKEVLKPYFEKIKYIYQENRGAASARNTGIKHSQCEYIAFLDADDVWLPEKLQIQVDYLDKNPEVALVYSRPLWMSEDGRLIDKKSRHKELPSGDVFNKLFLKCFTNPSAVILRKRVLNTIGLFDESLINCTDWDLWLRIAQEFKVLGISKPLYKYRDTSNSLSKKDKETVFKFRRQVIEKNYKLSQDLNHPIVPALYKKSLARSFYHAGKWYLSRGDRKKTLGNFFQSLKYNPFNYKILKYCFKIYIKQALSKFRMFMY